MVGGFLGVREADIPNIGINNVGAIGRLAPSASRRVFSLTGAATVAVQSMA